MKRKAVIVEDNENNLMLETDLLAEAGFTVFEATNAAEGIAVARREKPDVIIMDVRLADMRGTEAAMLLRQDKETSGIPIVFVTCSAAAGELMIIDTIHNSGLVSKPIDTRTFAKEILQLMKCGSPVCRSGDSKMARE